MNEEYIESRPDPIQLEIDALQKELKSTDYKILKVVEGYDIPDIAEIKSRRREIREKISALRDSQESGELTIIAGNLRPE